MTLLEGLILIIGGAGAGFINALAGGGSAITIPILTEMVGINTANGTNRIAILLANLTARRDLALDNLVLRQQLAVLQRSVPRPRLRQPCEES